MGIRLYNYTYILRTRTEIAPDAYKQGRRQNFGSGGGTSNKIFSGEARISVRRGHSAKIYSTKTFKKF